MSQQSRRAENIAIVEQFVEAAYRIGDREALDELLAPDAVFTGVRGRVTDMEEMKDRFVDLNEQWATAFPDLSFEIEQIVADEEGVAVRLCQRGTFEGEYMGMQPTGESFAATVMEMFTIRGGRIVEWHAVRDRQGFTEQLRGERN